MSTRTDDVQRLRAQLARHPADRIAWHNLAAAEGDLGRAANAAAAARHAIALGITAPETRLVLARALQQLGQLDDAERAFDEALRLRPAYADAHRDAAQLVWMRTGDVRLASQRIDAALKARPRDPSLLLIRSFVHEFAGDTAAALAAAEAGRSAAPNDDALVHQCVHLSLSTGRYAAAVELASAALGERNDARARFALCEALIAAGDLERADALAGALRDELPHDQFAIALSATIARLRNDSRYPALCDYDALVSTQTLPTPQGWPTLERFLDAVRIELERMHAFVAHPFHQSVRGGGQLTFNEDDMGRALIRTLFEAISAAVAAHLRRIGSGSDPMRSRNTGRFRFTGAWSVRLPSGGSHVDHVHPNGWLSSACYIALPSTIGTDPSGSVSDDRAGWLRFGRPGIATPQPLDAERWVQPRPGSLVLFPAYFWHGVEPFRGDEARLSVAFDVLPG